MIRKLLRPYDGRTFNVDEMNASTNQYRRNITVLNVIRTVASLMTMGTLIVHWFF